ncbi:lariat debranching enzyme, partial [Cichlidogyrus casuarinus]
MVRVCIVGCLHGELDKVYREIATVESQKGFKVELVLCCGDTQTVRNPTDLNSMSVPPKYYEMGDFYKYYSGELVAPIPTVFVGGNHEASSYLQELPYGGWVAPNIYFMGYAGVVQFAGLRIVGISGIYKHHDYNLGHFEHPPYTESSKRSAYHTRNFEVFRLMKIQKRVDIVLSHDWPRGVYAYGDTNWLLRRKPAFTKECQQNLLGSPASEQLLRYLQPRYWFSAHLHVKFAALIKHCNDQSSVTQFLALDKCLPRHDYLQFLDIEPDKRVRKMSAWADWNLKCNPSDPVIFFQHPDTEEEPEELIGPRIEKKMKLEPRPPGKLCLDPEWLTILKKTDSLLSLSKLPWLQPSEDPRDTNSQFWAKDEAIAELWDTFGGYFVIPENFEPTAPIFKPSDHISVHRDPKAQEKAIQSLLAGPNLYRMAQSAPDRCRINPQTELICTMLEITDPNAMFLGQQSGIDLSTCPVPEEPNSEKIDIDDDDDEAEADECPYEPQPISEEKEASDSEYVPSDFKLPTAQKANPESIDILPDD